MGNAATVIQQKTKEETDIFPLFKQLVVCEMLQYDINSN